MSHEAVIGVKVFCGFICTLIGSFFPKVAVIMQVQIPLIVMQLVQLLAWGAAIFIAYNTYNKGNVKKIDFDKLFDITWKIAIILFCLFGIYKIYLVK